MSYMFKITTTERDGKIAIWIERSDQGRRSIWDLPKKQATTEVLAAINSAVRIGMEIHRQEIVKVMDSMR